MTIIGTQVDDGVNNAFVARRSNSIQNVHKCIARFIISSKLHRLENKDRVFVLKPLFEYSNVTI